MQQILDRLSENMPKQDSFFSLLIFLLMVFGGLYILFKIIFFIGDDSPAKKERAKKKAERKKEEDKKREEAKRLEEEKRQEAIARKKQEKENKREQAKEARKNEEIIILKDVDNDELVFLQESKPEVETRPYYMHEHNDSYVTGKYNGEVKSYTYGSNYLHDYYNDGKTFDYINPSNIPAQKVEQVKEDNVSKSDELLETYKHMPTELKKYILDKILSNKY